MKAKIVILTPVYNDWKNLNFDQLNRARDIVAVTSFNEKDYFASWYNGISVMQNESHIIKYGYYNTGGILDTTFYSNNRIQISDLKFDNNNNLWGLNSQEFIQHHNNFHHQYHTKTLLNPQRHDVLQASLYFHLMYLLKRNIFQAYLYLKTLYLIHKSHKIIVCNFQMKHRILYCSYQSYI